MVEIIAQTFGILGMICNAMSFQQKTHKGVIAWQFFSSLSFSVNYFMLGAIVGGALNFIGMIRAAVFFFKEKTNANGKGWLAFFIIASAASYPIAFTAFGKAASIRNLVIEILPVTAMLLETVGLRIGSAKAVRKLGLLSSPMWLTYNCFSGSIGAIATEILNLISIVVGIIRFDIKKDKSIQS